MCVYDTLIYDKKHHEILQDPKKKWKNRLKKSHMGPNFFIVQKLQNIV